MVGLVGQVALSKKILKNGRVQPKVGVAFQNFVRVSRAIALWNHPYLNPASATEICSLQYYGIAGIILWCYIMVVCVWAILIIRVRLY